VNPAREAGFKRGKNVLHSRTCVSVALLAGALLVAPSSAGAQATAGEAIDGQYIVVLKDQTTGAGAQNAKTRVRERGGRVQREYSHVVNGFSAKLTQQALAEVRSDPAVDYVEPDRVITLDTTQTNATWGLDRIDQRNRPLSTTYSYDATGAGVTAYIIDTGIRFTHSQFGGRASSGFDAVDGGTADDCNGHGTHVSGTVGGSTYGVAKGVHLVAVRVLDCNGSGTTSGVVAGIDWVTSTHAAGAPAVANMSLGGGVSTTLDNAVGRSIADGVTYAVAAGNESTNACNGSPSRVAAALTVGSTTSTDARSSFSNFGTCVDIFAPGSSITSAWYSSDAATNTISGTSMATPHVVGAAALYLQGNSSATPATVAGAIVANATAGVVGNPGTGSPNRLLYTNPGSAPTPQPTVTATPTATATATVTPACDATFRGTLSATGQSLYSAACASSASGTHHGVLTGPSGADFDVYLQKLSGSTWSTVASGLGPTANEDVRYSGTPGTYRWRVYAYSGSGSFSLAISRP
jgi:subtilisin family serine protease